LTKIVPAAAPSIPDQYAAAAANHGGATGFATLLAQVSSETGFQPNSVNKATGAEGPFQFVKNTWLDQLRQHGAELGVKPELLAQIKRDPTTGRVSVADPEARKTLLDLRHDLDLSAKVASLYLDQNRASLGRQLGRAASDSEVQMSFLLGANGASRLISAAAKDPTRPVDQVLPKAVAANRSLFTDKSGQTRGAGDAVAHLAEKFGRDRTRFTAYLKAEESKSPALPAARSKDISA